MYTHMNFKMRLFRIDQLIHERGQVSLPEMVAALRCSVPTLKRDLRYLREKLKAPIVYSRKTNSYSYVRERALGLEKEAREEARKVALPSAWYSPVEITALMTALQLFDRVENEKSGLLAPDMKAMKSRLLSLVQEERISARELLKRVRVILPSVIEHRSPFFEMIGNALAHKTRLRITYWTKSSQTEKMREISPVRLVNYKNRWYLQAWCHLTDELRTFSLEYILAAEPCAKNCRAVPMKDLEALDSGFGIFSGGKVQVAVIHFDAQMGAYVRDEIWHPDQQVLTAEEGTVELRVPYTNETELVAQILHYGAHACVMAPESLKKSVLRELEAALAAYSADRAGGV